MNEPRLLLRDGYICQSDGSRFRRVCRVDGEILQFWWKHTKVEHPVTLDDLRRLMHLAAEREQ